jgi:hypothetical protein
MARKGVSSPFFYPSQHPVRRKSAIAPCPGRPSYKKMAPANANLRILRGDMSNMVKQ